MTFGELYFINNRWKDSTTLNLYFIGKIIPVHMTAYNAYEKYGEVKVNSFGNEDVFLDSFGTFKLGRDKI